jgi:hypothetical protein
MSRDICWHCFRLPLPGCWRVALVLAVFLAVSVGRAEETTPAPPAVPDAAASLPAQAAPAPADAVVPAVVAPLHERIDVLVEAAALGPVAPIASDADFLRRVYLDLNGTIPDAATAKAFLDDADPNKRAALIDRLLAAPRFARHMQHTFDVMWLERRRGVTPGKGVAEAEWEAYLQKSFADNKPLDQLIREILSADGADPALRAAAKFYLDRDGEPNLLARDVGRLFFGRDLQCAQCHDHPIVDDYLQSEYYGLMAFVNRGTIFTDAKNESTLYYSELADGEVNFKSVFTGNARDRVLPGLPDGEPLSEPQLAKEEQYVVAPDKDVRPVPKYSRRAQLAALATSGTSAAFNRNLANRLWAQMLGRGIVHPLDMQHSGNPPVHSELLALLADELVRMKYDMRQFLREVALSRAYQRSSSVPEPNQPVPDPAATPPALADWQRESERLTAELPKLEEAVATTEAAQSSAYEKYAAAAAVRATAEKTRGEAKKASDELSAALAAAIKDVTAKDETVKALVAARVAADAAVAKLPEDKALIEAATTFKNRANEVDTALAAARATVAEKTPLVQAASVKLAEIDKTLQPATTEVNAATAMLATAEAQARQANTALRAAKTLQNELTARIADARRAAEYQALRATAAASQAAAKAADEQLALLVQQGMMGEPVAAAQTSATEAHTKASAELTAADKAWTELVDRSTVRFTLAPLKALAPEQLTWATMQAVGMVEAQQAAVAAEAQKLAEAAGEMTPEARTQLAARGLEDLVNKKLTGNIPHFVGLFGQQPGQAPSFQATVHQALFLANGGLLTGWINPAGGNLTERLAKLEDPQAVAEELYLSVFTRRPAPEEVASVAEVWQAAAAERPAAARDMVWSLLTSSEFRFNH